MSLLPRSDTPHPAPSEAAEVLPRNLGVWGIWLLVVNGLIGAGIFGLPSGAAALAGEYSPYIYLLCALLVLPILLCFAELTSYFRGTGGPVRFVGSAFGDFAGFQAGWLFYIARAVSFAANSVLLIDSISYFWPAAGQGLQRTLLLTLLCLGLTWVNARGAVQSIRSLGVLTVIKVLVLLGFIAVGMQQLLTQLPTTPMNPTVLDLGGATLLLVYAFVGFESAVVPAGECKQPQRDMPIALLSGLAMVTVLYCLVQWVCIRLLPDISQSSTPLLDVAALLLGPTGAVLLMIGVVSSVGANLLGAIFSTPRISYALALNGSLPSWFGQVHSRFLTPANAIWFFGITAWLLALFGSFIWLAAATVLTRALLYLLCSAAIPVLRPKLANKDSFILPGGYSIVLLSALACAWLMWQVKLDSLILTSSFVVFGSILFGWTRYRRKIQQ